MKKLVLAGTSALAAVAIAGVANAQDVSTGYIGIDRTDFEGIKIWSIYGTGSVDVAENWEVQGDLAVNQVNFSSAVDATVWSGTVHGFYDSENLKVGAFLGYEDFDGADLLGYGLEARLALSDNWTFGLSGGLGDLSIGAFDIDVEALRGEFSIFLGDRTRVDLGVTHLALDGGGPTFDTNTMNFTWEHQLEANPYSFVFSFESANSDLGDSEGWTVGVRRVFGGNLRDRDRTSSPFGNISTNVGGGKFGTVFGATLGFIIEEDEGEEGEGD